MNEVVSAVEPNGRKHESPFAADDDDVASPAESGGRFVHASGARPLDGYTIKRGIGHGGFGEVYYAVSDAGKEVALKLVRRNLDVELRGIRQCLNLKHPNLLSVFDIRKDAQGDNWVVMEYVNGQCLDEVVSAHPQGLSPAEALSWIHGVAAGVAYLHDHGIVHRDLKPGNIFVDEGIVKIGDYGLSKFISCSRRSGQTESIGTVHYMAPEVANGRYGKEIDVYALGVVFYEILTGRVPFEGESIGEVLMKHLTAEPDVSMLTEPYRSVVAKALKKDPQERYSSAAEMMADLPRSPAGGPLPKAPTTESERRGQGSEEIHTAEVVDEEPIYRLVKQAAGDIRDWWQNSNVNAPLKLAVLVALAVFLVSGGYVPIVALAMPLLLVYCVYYMIRQIVLVLNPKPHHVPSGSPFAADAKLDAGDASAGRLHHAARHARRHAVRRLPPWAINEIATEALQRKPGRERIVELLGSMVGSAVVCVVMCLVGAIFHSLLGGGFELNVHVLAQYAWLTLCTIAGTWSVMIPAKAWEGASGDAILRRFVLLVIGLGLGLAAAGAAGYTMVDLPHDLARFGVRGPFWEMTRRPAASLHAEHVLTELPYYLASFGLLLMVVRWWRLTDPLRHARLSLWAVLKVAVWAFLVADLCGFPQPWLILVACAMAVSLQLASAWVPPRQRIAAAEMD